MREISRLKEFLAVVQHGSVKNASLHLTLSEPHVFKVIHDLEDEYGVKFFSRRYRGLFLTEAGKKFHEFAERMIDECETIKETFTNNIADKRNGIFTIFTSPGLTLSELCWILPTFSQNNPHTVVVIRNFTNMEEYDDFDVMIGPKFEGLDRQRLTQVKIRDVTFKLYVHKKYIEKFGCPQTPRDLDNHQIIAFAWNSIIPFHETDDLFQTGNNGKKRKPAIVMPYSAGEMELVKGGGGIGCIHQDWDGASDPDIINVLPEISKIIPIYFISKKGGKNHLVKELQNLLFKNKEIQTPLGEPV